MSKFLNNYRGTYVKDLTKPVAVCDISSGVFNRQDLKKQMIWAGNRKVWNGLLGGEEFIDVPNEQSRPPKVRVNPEPVELPRPPMPFTSKTVNSNDTLINPETVAEPQYDYIDPSGYPEITTEEARNQLNNIGFGNNN